MDKLLRAWSSLGQAMGRIVGPVALGVIFFLILTPVAIVCRLAGRDELRLKVRQRDTYWFERGTSEPSRTSFKNQF